MATDEIPPRPDAMHPAPAPPPVAPVVRAPGVAALPPATWKWWEAVGVYLVAFFVGALATLPVLALVPDNEDLAIAIASPVQALATLGVLVAWLQNSHPGWASVINFRPRVGFLREFATSFGFGLILYPAIAFAVGTVVTVVLELISNDNAIAPPEQVPQGLPAAGVVATVIYAIVIAPIAEEFFFRGVLFRSVRDRYGIWPGLLATGFAFSLVHYIPDAWENTMLLIGVMFFNGMALAWWYERRGTIVASIAAHMAFNVIGVAFLLSR
jgi:membrane protease YdiL (CAAX protease family)